jgi:hypothetical protein
VSDGKKKANRPKETGSQEKPDNQAPRIHKHRLLMGLMRQLFLDMGSMTCITKPTTNAYILYIETTQTQYRLVHAHWDRTRDLLRNKRVWTTAPNSIVKIKHTYSPRLKNLFSKCLILFNDTARLGLNPFRMCLDLDYTS